VPLLTNDVPIEEAATVLIILHGKAGAQKRVMDVALAANVPDVAILAPGAEYGPWWPAGFRTHIAPDNPFLLRAMTDIEELVTDVLEYGVEAGDIVVCGNSQGGCVALEHGAVTGRPYRAVIGFSTALLGTVGPQGELVAETERYAGPLDGQRYLLFGHAGDPAVPARHTEASAAILKSLGARVDLTIEPGARHKISSTAVDTLADVLCEKHCR